MNEQFSIGQQVKVIDPDGTLEYPLHDMIGRVINDTGVVVRIALDCGVFDIGRTRLVPVTPRVVWCPPGYEAVARKLLEEAR